MFVATGDHKMRSGATGIAVAYLRAGHRSEVSTYVHHPGNKKNEPDGCECAARLHANQHPNELSGHEHLTWLFRIRTMVFIRRIIGRKGVSSVVVFSRIGEVTDLRRWKMLAWLAEVLRAGPRDGAARQHRPTGSEVRACSLLCVAISSEYARHPAQMPSYLMCID